MSGQEIPEHPLPDAPPRDGIGEDDNAIPGWFNLGFYGLIVFGLGYIFYLGAMAPFSAAERHDVAVAAREVQLAALREALPDTNPFRGDATAIAEGAEVYRTICTACHLPEGQGLVGPSLVDPYWKYGNSDSDRFSSVSEGRPLGMPPWGPQLGTDKVWKVLAFTETLPKSAEPGVGSPEYDAAQKAAANPGGN